MNDDTSKSVSAPVLNARIDCARRDQRWLGAFCAFIIVSIIAILISLYVDLNRQ